MSLDGSNEIYTNPQTPAHWRAVLAAIKGTAEGLEDDVATNTTNIATNTADIAEIESWHIITKENANAGAAVIGTPVYISSATQFNLAQANGLSTAEVFGLVRDTSIASGASGEIQTDGIIEATTAQWDAVTGATGGLTAGSRYFLDPSTAGRLTTTAPTTVGQVVAVVGIALDTTHLEIMIGQTILL